MSEGRFEVTASYHTLPREQVIVLQIHDDESSTARRFEATYEEVEAWLIENRINYYGPRSRGDKFICVMVDENNPADMMLFKLRWM